MAVANEAHGTIEEIARRGAEKILQHALEAEEHLRRYAWPRDREAVIRKVTPRGER